MLVALISTVVFVLAGSLAERHAGVPVAAASAFYSVVAAGLWIGGTNLHRRQMRRLARADVQPEAGEPERRSAMAAVRLAAHCRNVALGALLAAVIPLLRAATP